MKQNREGLKSTARWLLLGMTVAAYWGVSSSGFVNYDDQLFVCSNPHVYSGLSFHNLLWAFTTLNGGASSYLPLTWVSHQLDCQIFGLNAGAQHLTNLWLHAANAVLLFTLLEKMTGKLWRSAMVAALFALHPLHVETVAWISERKSLVCVFFWLLTALAYFRYTRRQSVPSYLLVVVSFTAALLSKPIAVALPITLLLMDFWPLRRYQPGGAASAPQSDAEAEIRNPKAEGPKLAAAAETGTGGQPPCAPGASAGAARGPRGPRARGLPLLVWGKGLPSGLRISDFGFNGLPLLVWEKGPLLLLAGLACWVTLVAQTDLGAIRTLAEVPMSARVSNSIVAPVLYLGKTIWPVDLAPIYPLRQDWAGWQVAGCGLLLLSVSFWAVWQARRRPYLLVGWIWYLVTLFPTLGLVQVGLQGLADRYSYVPLIGIFLMAVWELGERVAEKAGGAHHSVGIQRVEAAATRPSGGRPPFPLRLLAPVGGAAVVGACAVATSVTAGYWHDSVQLFQHAIRATHGNYIACHQLGMALLDAGNFPEAERLFRQSLSIRPRRQVTEQCLAWALLQQGDSRGAFEHYSAALKLGPDNASMHRALAGFFSRSNDPRFHDPRRAVEEAHLACQLDRFRSRGWVAELAEAYAENRQFKEALDAANKALALCAARDELETTVRLLDKVRQMAGADAKTLARGAEGPP